MERPKILALAAGRADSRAASQAESRVVALRDDTRWRATVVARLISEDLAAGTESARLVLRLECLTARRHSLRVALPGARSLRSVADDTLRAIAGRAPARRNPRPMTRGDRRR